MIKNNISSNCPTYEELNLVFPDTSNKYFSGGFIYKDGYYQRDKPRVNNHWGIYEYDENTNRVWIDPPGDVIEKMPRVYIAASDFTYKIDKQKITNSSYIVGQSRYVSSTCTEIIISADNWLYLLGDSIYYMLNDCDPEYTNFDEIKLREWEATVHDITTSAKYKLEQWIKESKEAAKSYLIPK